METAVRLTNRNLGLSTRADRVLATEFGPESQPHEWAHRHKTDPIAFFRFPNCGSKTQKEIIALLVRLELVEDPANELRREVREREKHAQAQKKAQKERVAHARRMLEKQAKFLGGDVVWHADVQSVLDARRNRRLKAVRRSRNRTKLAKMRTVLNKLGKG
jgi:hypothetical protein